MRTETTGIVVRGHLQLDHPIELPDKSRVRIAVEPEEDWRIRFNAGLRRWRSYARSARFTPAAGDTRGMNCMNAVDTNILVYYVDADEPAKRPKAIELLARLGKAQVETLLLWQVAAEFLSCLRRWENKGRTSRQDTLEYLNTVEPMFRSYRPRKVCSESRSI